MPLREVLRSPGVRRLLGLAVVCGIVILGGRLFLDQPVKLTVVYEIGAAAPQARALVASYRRYDAAAGAAVGEVVLRKRYNYPDSGAPAEEQHLVRLKRGAYQLEITLETTAGPRTATRTVEVRGDGDVMRVALQ